ncbi:GyrI-like domain-containing protein [Flavobacterium sp. K5-23]|uniref:GyrI-like domain-containing protein n=1 Tax=Flavobacterium sp. K5-23 TaxID=2746225 RepID=UPI0020102A4F|nr:GyrI-like domain-containing protein [Flavobacterium sp. K5-23]UQD55291.1 GyrI-like domain-containing protein [Flavobacterium sp. K5-23]
MTLITQLEATSTCGLSVKLTTSQIQNFSIIQNHWIKFNAEIKKLNLGQQKGDWEKFGITYKIMEDYFYMAAIPFSGQNLPDDFICKEIPKGEFVSFIHKGNMNEIKNTLYDIYKKVLPNSELKIEPHSKTGFIHFERYDFRFKWNDPNSIIEIYLPLSTSNLNANPEVSLD